MFPTPPQNTPLLGPETSDLAVINEAPAAQELNDTDEAITLLSIIQDYDRKEEFARQEILKKCRKHLNYWNGQQYLAWDETANDWKTSDDIINEDPTNDIDPALHAKTVNVYKAHGEILIAALTAGLPAVRFFPSDADVAEDVTSARAQSRIAELIQKQNHARILLMRALFILYNQGMVACYNENKSDFRFGSIKKPVYSDVPVIQQQSYCPSCGADMPGMGQGMMDQGQMQSQMPPEVQGQMQMQTCPSCQQQVTPETDVNQTTQRQLTDYTEEPKNRECLEIYGPLNVKIPVWARDQFSTPYVILETEEHVALMREIYPELADKISGGNYAATYDQEARIPSHYKANSPDDLLTVQRVWLRAWAYNSFADPEKIQLLKQKYPDGAYVVILNRNLVAEIAADRLDEHWTISEQPLSEVLQAEPIGSPMVPLQDITNELVNLTLETIEFGIPETFADPRTLDFESYPRQEARPGQISEATAPGGQGLSAGFHEIKAATLSREVEPFAERITTSAQFVMGSYPSVYGGAGESRGGTAKEYEMSRASALQRLSSTWIIVQEWWGKVLAKAVRSYVKNMKEDTKFVQAKGSTFLNVWIRKSELSGDVEMEPEISEAFPVSWTQKRDIFLELIRMGNKSPDVQQVVRHPENASLIATVVGVPELYIPGDDDRNKQLYEIAQMITAQPQQVPGPAGFISSVPVTPEVDNHAIEAEICKSWMKSEVGLDAKVNNPAGYANVLAHLKEHQFFLQQQQQMQAQSQQAAPSKEGDQGQITDKGIAKSAPGPQPSPGGAV